MRFSIQTMIWGCVLLALLFAGGLAFMPKPIDVEVASVSEGPIVVTVQEDGKTRIREKYIISTPVAGRLARIELDSGDEVVDNETLVAVILPAEPTMLDARAQAQASARVDQAEAALKRAEASVEQAQVVFELSQSKFKRAEKLRESKSISQENYDIARTALLRDTQRVRTFEFDTEIATFELAMAKAALLQFSDNAEHGVEPFQVYAPISGKVLRVFQESSTVLTVGTPLIELGDPSNLEMEIDVLSTDAVRISPGGEMSIEHWGGKSPLKGRVRVVEPAAFTKISSLGVEEQRVNVIAAFDEPSERVSSLGDGYRVEARIVVEKKANARKIPNSALFRHEKEWHVFAIAGKAARLQPVAIGIQNEQEVEITGGLGTGEQVVLYPDDRLSDGSRVRIK
ncbi:MAG TPA: efflux transporter periplasmic adaptor subunit [Planctomycetaceae bacterium]|nr:efflux transporter periplasmic adaptor subunit [Planctomycetaceae bacterium]